MTMRRLYFDIDGTLLDLRSGKPKTALAEGRLERVVRRAQFDELVCVGNFVSVIRTMKAFDAAYDGLGSIFSVCQRVFVDEAWFRRIARLVEDPRNRALEIARDSDWWYVDDLAREFMISAGLDAVFVAEEGRRILVPTGDGDGSDVIHWIDAVVAAP